MNVYQKKQKKRNSREKKQRTFEGYSKRDLRGYKKMDIGIRRMYNWNQTGVTILNGQKEIVSCLALIFSFVLPKVFILTFVFTVEGYELIQDILWWKWKVSMNIKNTLARHPPGKPFQNLVNNDILFKLGH